MAVQGLHPGREKEQLGGGRSEWTKYHAFINCQDLRLTANRSNIDNTPGADLAAIQKTVERVFKERITGDPKFQKYQEELEKQRSNSNTETPRLKRAISRSEKRRR
jgi:hypothetical protein